MNKERLQYLLEQWMDRTVTPEEERELAARLREHREDGAVPGLLAAMIAETAAKEVLPMEDRERMLSAILEIDKTISTYKKTNGGKAICPMKRPDHSHHISFRRWGWVAASVILLLAEAAVVAIAINTSREQQHAKSVIQSITPHSRNAALTLVKGAGIHPDSAGKQVIQQGAENLRDSPVCTSKVK